MVVGCVVVVVAEGLVVGTSGKASEHGRTGLWRW